MGYSSIQTVQNILANALTRSTNIDGQLKILNKISNQFDRNVIGSGIIYQFITWADEEINGDISSLYITPLIEKVELELELLTDVNEYNDTIELDKANLLVPGDVLVFIDGPQEERHIVDEVVNNTTITLEDTLLGFYTKEFARVLRVKFPDPISLISARLAAGNIYDKYFASQVDPGISDYGNNLRAMAIRDMNSILNGRVILRGQKRIGNRFFNSNLRGRYELPSVDGDSSRDIGQIK